MPSRTIMLRQLPLQMDDEELRNEFKMQMIPFKDVRLVKHRDTGASRGFAFVEFNAVEEAQQWMNANQVNLIFFFYKHILIIRNCSVAHKICQISGYPTIISLSHRQSSCRFKKCGPIKFITVNLIFL